MVRRKINRVSRGDVRVKWEEMRDRENGKKWKKRENGANKGARKRVKGGKKGEEGEEKKRGEKLERG